MAPKTIEAPAENAQSFAAASEGETMNVNIYIDENLFDDDGIPNLPQSLLFGRMVNGKVNVVFATKEASGMGQNNVITWQQKYAISAYKTTNDYADGSTIRSGTKTVPITSNQYADWNWKGSVMPTPSNDEDLKNQNPGAFGTKHEPGEWLNAVWCQTLANPQTWAPIYTDTTKLASRKPAARSYSVENRYYINFEDKVYSNGVSYTGWFEPVEFEIPPGKTEKYLSYGAIKDNPSYNGWYEYNKSDPQGHNPDYPGASLLTLGTQSTPNLAALSSPEEDGVVNSESTNGIPGTTATITMDWHCESINAAYQDAYAKSVWNYIDAATKGYLTFLWVNRTVPGVLNLEAALDDRAFPNLLPGQTDEEKIIALMRAVLQPIASSAAPASIKYKP